ncbi:MAG: hypothetical protein AAF196_19155 [Planctomycetota bacterium]
MSSGSALRWFLAAVVTSFTAGLAVGLVAPRAIGSVLEVDEVQAGASDYLGDLRARYGLDPEQVARVSRVLDARDRECREIAARGGDGRSLEQERIRALLRADDRIARVLNDEQRERFLSDTRVRVVHSDAQIVTAEATPPSTDATGR